MNATLRFHERGKGNGDDRNRLILAHYFRLTGPAPNIEHFRWMPQTRAFPWCVIGG
jgi:hypothetical protein